MQLQVELRAGILVHRFQFFKTSLTFCTHLIFRFAASIHGQTSHATQWAFYLLSRNPEAQTKVLTEVRKAVGAHAATIPEEALANMPYVKAVIKETLRLYPVAPFLTRILDHDISLNGYNVPAGVSSPFQLSFNSFER